MLQGNDGDNRKICFVITPIGPDNSPVRRHIDGVINEAIIPVLDELKFKVEVSHRIYTPGQITAQILRHVYEDDLVIANLTNLNPNVMYELALRHATRKPIVHICEKGTNLPFDIQDTRTVFYTNDMYGVGDLKKSLREAVKTAMENAVQDNPIYRAIKDSIIIREDSVKGADRNLLPFLIERLDRLESLVSRIFNSTVGGKQGGHTIDRYGFALRLVFRFRELRDRLVKDLLHKVEIEFSKIPHSRVELGSSELNADSSTIKMTVLFETQYPITKDLFDIVINNCNTDEFKVESRSIESVLGDAVL